MLTIAKIDADARQDDAEITEKEFGKRSKMPVENLSKTNGFHKNSEGSAEFANLNGMLKNCLQLPEFPDDWEEIFRKADEEAAQLGTLQERLEEVHSDSKRVRRDLRRDCETLRRLDRLHRDLNAKISRLLSEVKQFKCAEVNILLVGWCVIRKSTFVNTLANFMRFNSFREAKCADEIVCVAPIKFWDQRSKTLFCHSSEYRSVPGKKGGRGGPPQEECQCYVFHCGNQLKIRLIDTPGLRGPNHSQRDAGRMEKVLEGISHFESIHAVWVLGAASYYGYIMRRVLDLLHPSARRNMVFICSNAELRNKQYKKSKLKMAVERVKDEIRADDACADESGAAFQTDDENLFCFNDTPLLELLMLKKGLHGRRDCDLVTKLSNEWDDSSKDFQKLLEWTLRRKVSPHCVLDTLTKNQMQANTGDEPSEIYYEPTIPSIFCRRVRNLPIL